MNSRCDYEVCINLKQNIINTAVNEWRKRLLVCIMGQHFEQFICRQLKNKQCQKCEQNMFYALF